MQFRNYTIKTKMYSYHLEMGSLATDNFSFKEWRKRMFGKKLVN